MDLFLDDSTPIGCFGCDKRQDPGCCVKFCCAPCVLTNYHGLALISIIAWVLVLFAHGDALFGILLCCGCLRLPLYGKDYKPQIDSAGQPLAGQPVIVVNQAQAPTSVV